MDKQATRKMVIAPLMLLAVMLSYSQRAGAYGPYDPAPNQRRDGAHLMQLETVSTIVECRRACAMEAECRSWVYVREWTETGRPMCHLRSTIGRPHYDTCCTSGIKPSPPAVNDAGDRAGTSRGKQAPRSTINPQDKPRQLIGPNEKPTHSKSTSAIDARRFIENGPGKADVAISDAKVAARERWRALAEELAFGLVSNCVAQLTSPDVADPRNEDAEFRNPAPTGGCVASPMRKDR